MHPMVKPALRRGWRDLNTVQFGMAPAHALVLGPLDTATGSLLTLFDGTRGLPLLRDEGRRMGLPDGHVDGLVERLSRAGLLDDATGGGPAADALRGKPAVLDRLRPDAASLSSSPRARRGHAAGWRPATHCASRYGARAESGPSWPRRWRARGWAGSMYRTAAASSPGTWRRAGCPWSPSANAGTRPHGARCAGRHPARRPVEEAPGPLPDRTTRASPW